MRKWVYEEKTKNNNNNRMEIKFKKTIAFISSVTKLFSANRKYRVISTLKQQQQKFLFVSDAVIVFCASI